MYNDDMPPGRPASKPRPVLGTQIALARKEKGFTQQELADKLKVTQRVITYWEREPVALRPEQLSQLADALGVTADFLLGREKPKRRGSGPKGKAKHIFEEVSKLPRAQQDKIFDLLEPFISAHTKA
ncbi:MAG: transcriptional regulator with XRE-family HTH domain [Akkermansiaceae bacterium]|jgi:transcriptional regulator with XRE-family HTH domain